ncbi:MAG: hypothetical protein OXB95_01985 [Rhodobacteraceae bacterium]|nr:hypothetical protein [Paracoccaceae bacterium]
MRLIFPLFLIVPTVLLLWWSTSVKYDTRQLRRELTTINRQIDDTKLALGLLQAEWSYLNRPERLQQLAFDHYEQLKLLTLTKNEFSSLNRFSELQDRGLE